MAILIVDDSANMRLLLQNYLLRGKLGEIFLAASAQEAIDYLGIGVANFKCQVDLILLDILMEGMDGIEFCRQIKAETHLADIPIIMVTGVKEPETLQQAFEAGCTDYLIKPVNKLELLARVRTSLKLKHEMYTRRLREDELVQEITTRIEVEKQLEQKVIELEESLRQVKVLQGMLPICSYCKNIRDDSGYWNQLEGYFGEHADVDFSHGICPKCAKKHFPDIKLYPDE